MVTLISLLEVRLGAHAANARDFRNHQRCIWCFGRAVL